MLTLAIRELVQSLLLLMYMENYLSFWAMLCLQPDRINFSFDFYHLLPLESDKLYNLLLNLKNKKDVWLAHTKKIQAKFAAGEWFRWFSTLVVGQCLVYDKSQHFKFKLIQRTRK